MFDFKRTATFSFVECFYVAPLMYINYSFILPRLVPATARYITFKKVAIDQTAFACILTSGFFVLLNLIEGFSLKEAVDHLREKLWQTMCFTWKLWIPTQCINFYFVPIKYQVLFANMVSIIDNTMLSFIYNQPTKEEQKALD